MDELDEVRLHNTQEAFDRNQPQEAQSNGRCWKKLPACKTTPECRLISTLALSVIVLVGGMVGGLATIPAYQINTPGNQCCLKERDPLWIENEGCFWTPEPDCNSTYISPQWAPETVNQVWQSRCIDFCPGDSDYDALQLLTLVGGVVGGVALMAFAPLCIDGSQ